MLTEQMPQRKKELVDLLNERSILKVVWPTPNLLKKSIERNMRHSYRVELICKKLGIKSNYPSQQPHDLKGLGSKLQPDVVFGFAIGLDLDKSDELYSEIINYAIDIHTSCQSHHDERLISEVKVQAIDALCTMIENRGYNGGPYNFKDISSKINIEEKGLKSFYMKMYVKEMEKMDIPDLTVIKLDNLEDLKNLGVDSWIHKGIIGQGLEAIKIYESVGYKLMDAA
ncbi:MAG: hypothetical protein KAQ83_00450 [Nanoarchaeota archaeon]|nr:hypothetical protein [Nanoarchaeota archaeon]